MKVIFLFMSQSSASQGATTREYPKHSCGQRYMDDFNDSCYFKMMETLLNIGVIDDLKIFYESNIEPGIAKWIDSKKAYCEVIPEIRFVKEYIEEDTIIFVRGGFKHWHDLLLSYKDKNWLMLYAANTGRERWRWWDIILDDLSNFPRIDVHGRYFFPFAKPVNEEVFYPMGSIQNRYDFCIGASHIHDKKGQWRAVEAIIEYNKKFGDKYGMLYAIMPGSSRGGEKTTEMFRSRLAIANCITIPGYVNKRDLNKIFNASKYFIHLGNHGQNDRGPLEAIAAGTQVIIGNAIYHAPFLSEYNYIGCNLHDPDTIINNFRVLIKQWNPSKKMEAYGTYKKNNGFNEVVIPRMKKLFELLGKLKPSLKSKEYILKEMEIMEIKNESNRRKL